jgi:uncharacterized protein
MKLNKVWWILLLTLQSCLAQTAEPVSELEKLFEAGRFDEFKTSAQALADQGNAEAQFLLGKAYHLGKGVKADKEMAKQFYGQAALQNNARAEHNLGLIFLDLEENSRDALPHLLQAEKLGFKMPTFYNLGRTYRTICNERLDSTDCDLSGDYFFKAWQIDSKNDTLDEAAAAAAKACLVARETARMYQGLRETPQYPIDADTKSAMAAAPTQATTYCAKAENLTEKGAQLGLARSTYNRGALEFYLGAYDKALPWLRLANEREQGLAAYLLAGMYQRGLGLPKDAAAALELYKRGAVLKNEQSIKYMQNYWQDEIKSSFEPDQIKAAMAEMAKLSQKPEPAREGLYRLKLIETMKANALNFPRLATQAMPSGFCLLKAVGPNYSLDWQLFAVAEPEDTLGSAADLVLIAQGMTDKNLCVALKADDQKRLKQALAKGQTPMFSWPGQRRLLTVTSSPKDGLKIDFNMVVRY